MNGGDSGGDSGGSSGGRSSGEGVGGSCVGVPEFAALLSENNVVRVNGEPYLKLGVLGRGGSSKVFKVRELLFKRVGCSLFYSSL